MVITARRIANVIGAVVSAVLLVLPNFSIAASTCDVQITEVSTSGMPGQSAEDPEPQDAIILKNNNSTTSATVQLVYIQSSGIRSESGTVSLGTIPAGSTRAYVSTALAPLNSEATSIAGLALASSGGSILIQKTSGAVYCDELGWGTAAVYEGAPVVAPSPGQTLVRSSGLDTQNNANDFALWNSPCKPPEITEVQPYVTTNTGEAVDAWIEVSASADPDGDCMLITNTGDVYTIPEADLPKAGETAVISQVLNSDGQPSALHLGESGSQFWFAGSSYFEQPSIYLPIGSIKYPAIERGQTWSYLSGLWRATYAPTPGTDNVYQLDPGYDLVYESPCDQVRITEILPNPSGEDSGREWIELHNTGDNIASLSSCKINIGDNEYLFSEYDALYPGEYQSYETLLDASSNPKAITLINSSDSAVLVAWQHLLVGGTSIALQSFNLYDGATQTSATEGESWARFDDGWRWSPTPTPGVENSLTYNSGGESPTEGPSGSDGDTPEGGASNGASAPITITELLPNPAAPQIDDVDEYVELFNAGSEAVDLAGYTLQTGNSFSYSYTLPHHVIEAGSYTSITSGQSPISLSNTSGQARLLDPSGNVISQSDAYTSAPEGVAWALVDGVWRWTSAPTAASANIYTPTISAVASSAAKTAVKAAAKTTSAKTTAAKTTATKAAKTTAAKASTPSNSASTSVKPAPIHIGILVAIGVAGLLYACYEYRTDIANRFYQLRTHGKNWRILRRGAKGG